MTPSTGIERHAAELVEAARRFQRAAEEPGSHVEAPDALVWIEEALQALSAAWYQVAADAAPRAADPERLSRETELTLVGVLQDVAAGFAQCARSCRRGRSAAADPMAESVG